MNRSPKLISLARRLLLGVAVVATLAAAIVVEENIRGNVTWRSVQAEYAARHEELGLDRVATTAVPDDRNIFKAPVWTDLVHESTPREQFERAQAAAGLDAVNGVRALDMLPLDVAMAREQMAHLGLLPKNSTAPDAQAVLTGMQPVMALLDGVCLAARERPLAAAPAKSVWQGADLRLGSLYKIAKLLAARAQAKIRAGHADDAFEETHTLLLLARACEAGRATMMQVLVATAMAGQAAENLKLADASHAWTSAQLEQLQYAFAELRLIDAFEESLRSERNWQLAIVDQLPQLPPTEKKQLQWHWWMIPGWVQQNKVSVCRSDDRLIDTVAAFGTPQFAPRLAALDAAYDRLRQSRSPYTHLARLIAYKASGIVRSFGSDVDALRVAETALALERYQRMHGRYPQALSDLTPASVAVLPLQSYGRPPQYTVTADGQGYTLEPLVLDPKGRKPRPWIQGGASETVMAGFSAPQSELERRRELRRDVQSQGQQR